MTRAAVLPACPKRDNCYINVECGEILQFTQKKYWQRCIYISGHNLGKIE